MELMKILSCLQYLVQGMQKLSNVDFYHCASLKVKRLVNNQITKKILLAIKFVLRCVNCSFKSHMIYIRNIISKKISSNQFYTFDNKMIYSCCALSILLQRSNRCHYLIFRKSYSWSQTFYNLIASQCGFHSFPILK